MDNQYKNINDNELGDNLQNRQLNIKYFCFAIIIFVLLLLCIILIINRSHYYTNNLADKLQQENNKVLYNNENDWKIINRTEWGATESIGPLTPFNHSVDEVILYDIGTHECENFESCKIQMNMIQLYFKTICSFEDIGYNFLIGGDGAVYEGIGWRYKGYHNKGQNNNSIAIALVGNHQNKPLTEKQLNAVTYILKFGMENNYMDKNYVTTKQQYQLSNECFNNNY